MRSLHRSRAIDRAFCSLLEFMPSVSFAWLARTTFDENALVNNFYVVDDRLVAESPLPDSIPWPVALVLGSFSRKHLFGRKGQHNLREVYRAAELMRRRIAWAYRFRDRSDTSSRRPLFKRDVSRYDGQLPASLSAFSSHLTNVIVQKAKRKT